MMYDFNSKTVTEDPVQVPDQLDEFVPLTPVQIFIKHDEPVRDEIGEVVPLTPVQITAKEEESVFFKREEPVLVSLVPVLPKVVDELPDDFEEGTGPLIINLENSSEDWSNHSDPLTVEQNAANASYVEYVEAGEPVLMELGATSTEDSLHSLRITKEVTGTVEDGELYDLTGGGRVLQVCESNGAPGDADSDGERAEEAGASRVPPKAYGCGRCERSFRTEGEMQMHTLSHAGHTLSRREVPEPKQKPKAKPAPVRTLRAQHVCGDCGESFAQLEFLMRHRFSHLRAVLRKPFGTPKLPALPKQSGAPKRSGAPLPQPQVSAVAGVSARTSPKRSPQQSVATTQPKRWSRRKKTRRRRVS